MFKLHLASRREDNYDNTIHTLSFAFWQTAEANLPNLLCGNLSSVEYRTSNFMPLIFNLALSFLFTIFASRDPSAMAVGSICTQSISVCILSFLDLFIISYWVSGGLKR